MFKFNPDGSLKLPTHVISKKEGDKRKMQGSCLSIRKEVVSEAAPKKCLLHIEFGQTFHGEVFLRKIHHYWNQDTEVPSKIIQRDEKTFDIEIGTCLRRCSECNQLTGRLRENMQGHTIINKGNCYFKERNDFDIY